MTQTYIQFHIERDNVWKREDCQEKLVASRLAQFPLHFRSIFDTPVKRTYVIAFSDWKHFVDEDNEKNFTVDFYARLFLLLTELTYGTDRMSTYACVHWSDISANDHENFWHWRFWIHALRLSGKYRSMRLAKFGITCGFFCLSTSPICWLFQSWLNLKRIPVN